MTIKNENFYPKLGLFLICLGLLLGVSRCLFPKEFEKEDMLEKVVEKKVDTWKDKNKSTHTVVPILETKNTADFIKLKAQDAQIKALQQEVLKYKKQLGKKGSVTIIQGTSRIDTVYVGYKNDIRYWRDSIQNKYIDWKYQVDIDNTNLAKINFDLETTDFLVITNKVQSNGWFKKDTFVTEVVNKNPYSKKVDVSTYRVNTPVPNRHWGIGPTVVYGIGNNLTPQWIVGIGVQYSFIKI